jgi:hypothetical protein
MRRRPGVAPRSVSGRRRQSAVSDRPAPPPRLPVARRSPATSVRFRTEHIVADLPRSVTDGPFRGFTDTIRPPDGRHSPVHHRRPLDTRVPTRRFTDTSSPKPDAELRVPSIRSGQTRTPSRGLRDTGRRDVAPCRGIGIPALADNCRMLVWDPDRSGGPTPAPRKATSCAPKVEPRRCCVSLPDSFTHSLTDCRPDLVFPRQTPIMSAPQIFN